MVCISLHLQKLVILFTLTILISQFLSILKLIRKYSSLQTGSRSSIYVYVNVKIINLYSLINNCCTNHIILKSNYLVNYFFFYYFLYINKHFYCYPSYLEVIDFEKILDEFIRDYPFTYTLHSRQIILKLLL